MDKKITRADYLRARRMMKEASGTFYYDRDNRSNPPQRRMRVKHLRPADAYEIYMEMITIFGAEDVRLYASTYRYGSRTIKSDYYDSVRVTLTPYWNDIKKEK